MAPMQQMLLAVGGSDGPFWISEVHNDSSGYELQFYGMDVNSDGNSFCGGKIKGNPSNRDYACLSHDTEGALRWFRRIDYDHGSGGSFQTHAETCRCDSSGNPFMAGGYSICVKLSKSNGSTLLQRLSCPQGYMLNGGWFAGALCMNGDVPIFFATFDGHITMQANNASVTGSVNFRTRMTDLGTSGGYQKGVNVDSSGNPYWLMESSPTGGSGREGTRIRKSSENGSTTTWWRELYFPDSGSTTGNYHSYKPHFSDVDGDGNVYVVGEHTDGDNRPSWPWAAKWNSSGTLQWKKVYGKDTTASDATTKFTRCAVDSSGNLYAVGPTQGSNGDSGAVPNGKRGYVFAQIKTDGTLGWGRYINENQSNWDDQKFTINDLRVDPSDNKSIYMCGYKEGSNINGIRGLTIKLSASGSATGTYGTWVIGDLPTSGTYTYVLSDEGGTEESNTTCTFTNYNRATSSMSSDNDSVSWSDELLTTVS